MKYSVDIGSSLSLKVRVGEFETFEEAKAQMTKFIVDLIDRQNDDFFNAWKNFKEDFPEEIQEILNSYEKTGTADFDGDIYNEDDNISYCAYESNFEISGKRHQPGYSLSINTDTINMYDPNTNYHFTLTEEYDGGSDDLTIKLLVNDGIVEVEVYEIPDEVLARLEPIDVEDK